MSAISNRCRHLFAPPPRAPACAPRAQVRPGFTRLSNPPRNDSIDALLIPARRRAPSMFLSPRDYLEPFPESRFLPPTRMSRIRGQARTMLRAQVNPMPASGHAPQAVHRSQPRLPHRRPAGRNTTGAQNTCIHQMLDYAGSRGLSRGAPCGWFGFESREFYPSARSRGSRNHRDGVGFGPWCARRFRSRRGPEGDRRRTRHRCASHPAVPSLQPPLHRYAVQGRRAAPPKQHAMPLTENQAAAPRERSRRRISGYVDITVTVRGGCGR